MRWHPSIASQPNASGVNRPADVNAREVADVPSIAAKVRIERRRALATGIYRSVSAPSNRHLSVKTRAALAGR
jgi:hypothetical protein